MDAAAILKSKGSEVVTIVQTAGILDAAKVLRDRKFGALVVVDQAGNTSGIVSERDIIRILGDMGAHGVSLKIADIMTRTLKTCPPTATVQEVMKIMAKNRIRHLPVEVGGKVVGLISQTDIIKQQLAVAGAEVQVMKNLNIAHR